MITCRKHSRIDLPARPISGRRVQKAIFSLIAAAAMAVGASAPVCAQSSAPGSQKAPTVLAKMVEKDDQVIYRTDSEEQKSSRELEREEKEKQERSWQMLERTEIFPYPPNPPRPPRQDPPRR